MNSGQAVGSVQRTVKRGGGLFSGILTLLLGILIWRQWPLSGAWAIGILVGIDVLMSGWAAIMLGAATRAGATEGRGAIGG